MKKMRTKNSGFIFVLVIVFVVITVIATSVLFLAVSSNEKITGVGTAERTEGYYAAIAGLRWAAMELRSQAVRDLIPANGSHTWSARNNYPLLFNDLGLHNPHDVTITITDNGNQTYTTTASYN